MQWCAKIESVVYTSFLIDAAKEVGIEVNKVRECPYFRSPATKDQAVQASFSCPDYVALESSMMTDESELGQGEEDAIIQDSEEDQSQLLTTPLLMGELMDVVLL